MNIFRRTPIIILVVILAASHAFAQGQLPTVLAQMDKASTTFESARADVHQEFYEKVIHAISTTQNGAIYFQRKNGQTVMGAVFSEVGSSAKPQVVQFTNGLLRLFNPANNQIDEFKAKQGQAESFFTLGFGGSGRDLAANWNITDAGPETIDNIKTEKLELTPKDKAVAVNFSKVVLWIDPTRAVSLKQVFYTPEGDYRTAFYTNIKLNSRIDTSTFAMHTDKKTRTVQH